MNVELDVYVEELKLALEYHGAQHYTSFFTQSMENQSKRDKNRRELCEQLGITLIEIPYWWDRSEGIL